MVSQRESYFILVVLDGSNKIVGTGALVVERKFIHNLGSVGHIEDIAVARDQQGKKLGLRIIQALDFVAEKVGCYKVSLSDWTHGCHWTSALQDVTNAFVFHRVYSTAPKPTRASTSNVDSSEQASKCRITMSNPRTSTRHHSGKEIPQGECLPSGI